jgi:hypothetical protein
MERSPEHRLWVQALHLEHGYKYPRHVTGREQTEQGAGQGWDGCPGSGKEGLVGRKDESREGHKVTQEE